jgi:NhaP-type Na+/H+ or K+/H+ antiporter
MMTMKKSKFLVATVLGTALVMGSAVPVFAAKAEAKPEARKAEAKPEAKAEAKPEA